MDAQLSANSDRRFSGHAIELKHLRSAVLAHSCGSFRKAARLLSIRHSALSRSVAQLEHLVGTALFERSSAGIQPTFAGHIFLNRANVILDQIDALLESTADIARGESGRLSVGLCTSVATGTLRDLLADFGRRCTRIEMAAIERSPPALHRFLQSTAADIIIVPGGSRSIALGALALWHERIFVLLSAAHPLAARETIRWTDLHDQTILLGTSDQAGSLEEMIESELLMHGIAQNVQRHDVSRHLVYGFTSMGLGVSFTLDSDTGVVGNNVVCRELHDDRGQMDVCFYAHWLPNNENPALHRFLTFLTERYPSPTVGER
ncbi:MULTISPECIES: LysR family transcriptional regulator [Bradyrhizobium]|uniref:DNA-binding transcriptional regulator, LysR family n=2 Tax=Bradyrhizobium TaxID=374 RepID=A0ABY0Q8K3_9BRAD|nr:MULTISPECIES: LysR family transcriptional regulator [Bradyrhizobium]SDJ69771.1 DNA-binding transcriptional regulator, LysR family [Bradyrhizobium ottawaense]SEC24127.1 DNA-binding transcriptional regulator, LysR family [Bradyrhizobium lablabi]